MSLGVGIETNLNGAPHMSDMNPTGLPNAGAHHHHMGNPMGATVNPSMLAAQTAVFNPNVKDSRWLTLEVCREFTRNKCTRPDQECKFAHPPPHVEVQNGRVTCCFDSIKGKCQRKDPPCKYLHPPQHLRDLLVQNGKNNLILKQMQMQAMLNPLLMQGAYPGVAAHPNILQYTGYSSPFISTVPGMISPLDGTMPQVSAPLTMPTVPTANGNGGAPAQKVQRPDRLENGHSAAAAAAGMSESAYSSVVNSMTDAIANNASSQYAALYSLQQGVNPNLPGMMPMIKRPAVPDKSGMPMYQPQSAPQAAAAAYSPFVPLPGQQQFVPVTQTLQYYRGEQSSPYSPGVAGHPAGLGPRY